MPDGERRKRWNTTEKKEEGVKKWGKDREKTEDKNWGNKNWGKEVRDKVIIVLLSDQVENAGPLS